MENRHMKKMLNITGYQRNANQNLIEILSHASQNGDDLKNLETDAGEDVEKQEHFYTVGGSVNQFNHCGRQSGVSSRIQKQKFHLTQQFHYWVYTQRIINCSVINTCTRMFIAALFTIGKTQNQPKCPSMIDWTRKMWHIIHHGILCGHKK